MLVKTGISVLRIDVVQNIGSQGTGDRYIGSLFRVDEPFPMIHRRTVIFLVHVATQSIPKKRRKKSRRADCLAGTIAVFIMDVMQDALLLSRYFLDKRPTRFPFHSYHI